MNISFLKAFNGDSILITYRDTDEVCRNILIDGGPSQTYQRKGKKGKPDYGELYDLISQLKKNKLKIDLLILTHVDDDHIDGILSWINSDPIAHQIIGTVWFNSGEIVATHLAMSENPALEIPLQIKMGYNTSIKQGANFTKWLKDYNLINDTAIFAGRSVELGELKFEFLSPNTDKLTRFLMDWKKEDPNFNTSAKYADYSGTLKECLANDTFEEDDRVANGSSIAFILTYRSLDKYLFLGDSHPGVILEQLNALGFNENNPLPVKLVKISHHGSKKNTSNELLKAIDTDRYVISTHGLHHGHPDKVLLARIIKNNPKSRIYFNYPELTSLIFSKQDKLDYDKFQFFDAKDINRYE
ncbi:MBL fold metallo-hydrolase [Sphingobacterium sp.]|uniref:ComEC/Rec2 family competence protein n=1 Tax=Sphingobacterium sp. TaxID=341027 RepID=UPI002587F954|nr:MBL fold metallo-hydrolase [Sphingobacterium sp.]WET67955.1 MAG: MBL fold metallo-hydrolase [Sphingobacterium sp.]